MPEEALPTSLQESLLALLAFDATHGTIVAAQVKPEHFDAPYQEIATSLLTYRRKYARPPGHAHLDDVFGFALERGERSPRLRRLLTGIADLAKGLNAEYVTGRVNDFIRKQTLKSAIMRAGELYQSGGDDAVAEVEQVLYGALRSRQQKFDSGTFLNDANSALRFLDHRPTSYEIGIPELDRIGVGATARELLLYIAPKGTGKSWFCVHMGTQGLIHRGKVLHISLEMDEEWVTQRYIQRIFNASQRPDPYIVSAFEFDELHRLTGWKLRKKRAKINFADPEIRQILRDKMRSWGLRLGNIVIKRFPSGHLTVPALTTYLDYLEATEKFIPTMLAVDYPDLMKVDPRNQRLELGRVFVDLRGLAVERNLALITPTQGTRVSMDAKRVKSTHVSEDISKVFTADTVLTYSRTPAEKLRGLARLNLAHARNSPEQYEIVITQAYDVGQYVIQSAFMSSKYWEQMKLAQADDGGDDGDD